MGVCYTVQMARCGNGVLEPGEECDDSSGCCDRKTCKLRAGAMCTPGTYTFAYSLVLSVMRKVEASHSDASLCGRTRIRTPTQASTISAARPPAPSVRPSPAATSPAGPKSATASMATAASPVWPPPIRTSRAARPRPPTPARSTSASTRAPAPTRTRASGSRVSRRRLVKALFVRL